MGAERHPFVLRIGQLLAAEAGTSEAFSAQTEDAAWVPECTIAGPVQLEGKLTRVADGILCDIARLDADVARTCVRCLTPYERTCTVSRAAVLFALQRADDAGPKSRARDERETDGLDIPRQQLDLRPLLREHFLLAYDALDPHCAPACKGLCPTCGENRNLRSCPHDAASAPEPNTPLADLRALWERNNPRS